MNNSNLSLYNLAVKELQISDGIVRSFKRELGQYKQVRDQAKAARAAAVLTALQGRDQEGGFLHE